MAPLDIDTVLGWRGRTVRDVNGEKIGTLGDVFLDQDSDVPAWGGVRTGLFGRNESFVPLEELREDGEDIVVPYTAEQVKDAPNVEPDVALTAAEEDRLFTHYGRGGGEGRAPAPRAGREGEPSAPAGGGQGAVAAGAGDQRAVAEGG